MDSKELKAIKDAAENGQAQAQVNLAHCYESGKGLNPDLKQAFHWYKRSANHGSQEAAELMRRKFGK